MAIPAKVHSFVVYPDEHVQSTHGARHLDRRVLHLGVTDHIR
jgi:hypothetical protein